MIEIPQHLAEKINIIPAKPGVYQMKDSKGDIIYIGKSKTLKTRVRSYFNTEHKWKKVKTMVFRIDDIDFIVTDTHLEARVLECELIKKIQPIYNAQFKNDKKYKYLKVGENLRTKPIMIANEREDENCFGPYRSKSMLLEVIDFFRNIYPISKAGSLYEFTYNILPQPANKDAFEKNKDCLIEILSNEESMLTFLSELENKMKAAASELQFEKASIYRDALPHIKYLYVSSTKKTNQLSAYKTLMGEKTEHGYKIFYISNHSIVLKKKYKRVTKEAIERFVLKAEKLETSDDSKLQNEKSNLDFKQIISSELQDETSKVILMLEDEYNIDEFINKLKKI